MLGSNPSAESGTNRRRGVSNRPLKIATNYSEQQQVTSGSSESGKSTFRRHYLQIADERIYQTSCMKYGRVSDLTASITPQ